MCFPVTTDLQVTESSWRTHTVCHRQRAFGRHDHLDRGNGYFNRTVHGCKLSPMYCIQNSLATMSYKNSNSTS